MPQVIHSFRGKDNNPRLKLSKRERTFLADAAKLCTAIERATVGYNTELADGARKLAEGLSRLATIEEHELTQPF